MTVNQLLQQLAANSPILQASFGLERESLRIRKENHRVAQTPHPAKLGSRSFHPYIQTDYSEPQLEFISPVGQSSQEALRFLTAITDVAGRSIDPDQYLWPLSMPPRISQEDIQIAQLEDAFEYHYREHLGETYGKLLQSMSGIHLNMGLGKDLMDQLFQLSQETDPLQFRNQIYLKLAQNFLKYRWLLTYLYGASVWAEEGFLDQKMAHPVRSLRNSSYGYVNHQSVQVSYQSLEDYVTTIEACVADGRLMAEKEFYSPVRLRGSKTSRDYLTKGITYLEFRNFDLNPYEVTGINQETLDTSHLFILALLWLDAPLAVNQELEEAKQLNNQIALSHPWTRLPETAPVQEILTAMAEIIQHFQLPDYYQSLLEKVQAQVDNPKLTLAGRLCQEWTDKSMENFGRKQGLAFADHAWQAAYALKGFEGMELSTQLILFDAIQKGLNLEILDEHDQFIKLWHGNHVELIKNGNMTSKDNYVVHLAMENKVVTKKLLTEKGFPVPAGYQFQTKSEALSAYPSLAGKPLVVKPKSTNFGLGISIFKEKASLEDYGKALELAFAEDRTILVEEFVPGTEYRFFVLNGKTEAVLLRRAASVVGDGKSTIAQLVAEKNSNPLRGLGHRSPLEKIQLGEIEQLMLQQAGYNLDSVPAPGVRVNLRENSNISTGGDSIDMTEAMHPSYKELASQMTEAIGAWVCGVDLIIPDHTLAHEPGSQTATCIELNFNPLMYMHTYCAEGPGQIVSRKVLDKLFPEID